MTNKLLAYLEEMGIGHNSFARKIGTSPTTLNRILRQGQIPSLELGVAIHLKTKGAISIFDWVSAIEPDIKTTNQARNPKKTTQKKKS